MTDHANGTSRKPLHVFAIIERKEAGKPAHWLKIGTAFSNRDGSLSIYLEAFPIGTNKLQVREPRQWDEDRNGSSRHDRAPAEAHP